MQKSRLNFYRNMFLSGATFNFLAGFMLIFLFIEFYTFIGGENFLQTPLFNAFRYLVGFLVVLFGFVYFHISQNIRSESSRLLATVSLLGKVIFFLVFTTYVIADKLPFGMAGLVFIDLVYALLFLEYVRYKKYS